MSAPHGARGLTALIAALTALPALSIDMSLPALPDLAGAFGVGAGEAQLSIGLFLAGFAVAQLACGPLSDRFGRRPIIFLGAFGMAMGTLLFGLSKSLPGVLFARSLGAR